MSLTRESLDQVKGLDPGIELFVNILRELGIDTIQSCEGGPGHSYSQPTIDFCGAKYEGFIAYAYAMNCRFPVKDISRVWHSREDGLDGPIWRMTFYRKVDTDDIRHSRGLSEEWEALQNMSEENKKLYHGRWVVVRGNGIVGDYESFQGACVEAGKRYDDHRFLIRPVGFKAEQADGID